MNVDRITHTLSRLGLAAIVMMMLSVPVRAQCPGSEPPSDFCTVPRLLSGAPGTQTVVMNTSMATGILPTSCPVPSIGHTVWFSITPAASGLLTFSTCHPSTTYDTVAEAFSGGDGECNVMTSVLCNDDTVSLQCSNGCSAYGSRLTFNVVAGTQYRIVVGSYNNNASNCNLCLGVTVTLCSGDTAPPEVAITSPIPQSCVCAGSAAITGSIADSGSGVASYVLDYVSASGGAWTTIAGGVGPASGILGVWDTLALNDQEYLVRLSAQDGCGNTSSTVVSCRVDSYPDSLALRSPSDASVVGGTVVADGTIWDSCAAGQADVHWAPVGPSPNWTLFTTLSPPWIINDPLGTWNSRHVVDGNYFVRATLITACGSAMYVMNTVVVDNTTPITVLSAPVNCARFNRGTIQVRGTIADANLASWSLQYTGGSANGWVTIASGTSPVVDGVLADWNTASLPWCVYTLRLTANDAAVIDGNPALHNTAEFLTTVAVGCVADANGNGVVSVQDIFDFLSVYFGSCP